MEPEQPTASEPPTADASTILVVTDDVAADSLHRALRWSTDLADRTGARLVLYDRSKETWTDSPHPSGVLAPDDGAVDERPHLHQQLAPARERGVRCAVWLSTLPSLGSVATAVSESGADVVVLPEATSSKLADRAVPGTGPAESLRTVRRHTRLPPVTIVEVSDHGQVDTLPAAIDA